jgi:hypothetical protein
MWQRIRIAVLLVAVLSLLILALWFSMLNDQSARLVRGHIAGQNAVATQMTGP